MLPHELYVAIQAIFARLRVKMHVTLRGLARTLRVSSLRVPRGALRVTLRVPREARARRMTLYVPRILHFDLT